MRFALAAVMLTPVLNAQWQLQPSNTTADLRGIHALGNGVAWASGSRGTVLHTTDNGKTWLACTVPPGAEALDFRGVQARNANIAVVMSAGKGELSRLYKTSDACRTWKLLFTNPDPEGFWDGLRLNPLESDGVLFGDPVDGRFKLWQTSDQGSTWHPVDVPGLAALPAEGAFAASNSSLTVDGHLRIAFATGSAKQARVFVKRAPDGGFQQTNVPVAGDTAGAGIFSLAFRTFVSNGVVGSDHWVAVGGDYTQPKVREGTAAFSVEDGQRWAPAVSLPGGYRSCVVYSAAQAWIAVGPNGTDISTDDGRNWHALRPTPQGQADEDQHWNALSLPFVVGPHGRIGLLREGALQP